MGTGAAYYTDYRFERRPNENLSLGRLFHIKERATLSMRIEFTNVFNRAQMPNPTSTNAAATQVTNPTTGVPTAGFGFVATGSIGATNSQQLPTSRQGSVVARLTF